MAFDFPSGSLTVGQIVNGPNNTEYQWDGTKWVALVKSQPFQIAFSFSSKPAAGAQLNVPMTIALSVPANLAGSQAYASAGSAAAAAFTFNKISGGTTTALGTMSVTGTTWAIAGAGGSLAVGDVLQCLAPATQDANLLNVGLAILSQRI